MKKQWNNQEIIDNIQAGKQEAANDVFKKCGGRLLQFFKGKFKLSHEDAEEALQNTMIRFIQAVREDKFRGDADVCTYLSAIGVNECLRIIKKNAPNENILINGMTIEEIEQQAEAPKDLIDELHYRLCVAKVLQEFEKNEENVSERLTALTLQFEGWSIKEIADKIGRTEGATKIFLFECRKKLKPYLLKCREEH